MYKLPIELTDIILYRTKNMKLITTFQTTTYIKKKSFHDIGLLYLLRTRRIYELYNYSDENKREEDIAKHLKYQWFINY